MAFSYFSTSWCEFNKEKCPFLDHWNFIELLIVALAMIVAQSVQHLDMSLISPHGSLHVNPTHECTAGVRSTCAHHIPNPLFLS